MGRLRDEALHRCRGRAPRRLQVLVFDDVATVDERSGADAVRSGAHAAAATGGAVADAAAKHDTSDTSDTSDAADDQADDTDADDADAAGRGQDGRDGAELRHRRRLLDRAHVREVLRHRRRAWSAVRDVRSEVRQEAAVSEWDEVPDDRGRPGRRLPAVTAGSPTPSARAHPTSRAVAEREDVGASAANSHRSSRLV